MGKNIKTLSGLSFEQCQTACNKNKYCKGIEFFRKSGLENADTYYKEGDCLLNSGTDTKNPPCNADYYQMYFWEKSENMCGKNNVCQTYTPTNGCVMGKNIKKIRNTTKAKCQTLCSQNQKCVGVEFFNPSGKARTANGYRKGDCLLNSSSNIESPACDADFYQMYFWEQGQFVECSTQDATRATTPKPTRQSSGTVNKYTSYYKPTTNSYSYNYDSYNWDSNTNPLEDLEEEMKKTLDSIEGDSTDLLSEFDSWLEKEADIWKNTQQNWGKSNSGNNWGYSDWSNSRNYYNYYYGY